MISDREEKKKGKDEGTRKPFAVGASLFHVGIDPDPSGARVTVCGVCHVSDLRRENITVTLERGEITVGGKGLSLTVFESHTVAICGHIEEIKLAYGKH